MTKILCFNFSCISGLVTQLPAEYYTFLNEVQGKLARVIQSVGKISHSLYPSNLHFKLNPI